MAGSYDVFISYSRADEEEVRRLAENLHQLGLTVFFDQWEIGPGDGFVPHLDRGIRETRNGVLVVSPASMASRWVAEEYAALLSRAVSGKQKLIPVLLKDAEVPPFLGNRVWIDLRGVDGPLYEKRVRELADTLQGKRPGPPPRTGVLQPRPGSGVRVEGPLRRRLRITPEAVTYIDKDGDQEKELARHQPRGLSHSTGTLLWQLERARHRGIPPEAKRAATATAGAAVESPLHSLLLETGGALTREFLDGEAGEAFRRDLGEAERLGFPVELGLEVEGELADLPWETLRVPGPEDAFGPPLALHPNIRLFRSVAGLGATPVLPIPGPLRILVAIGSPEEQNERGELLNMERELSRILDAVESARKQPGGREAYVRILNRGTAEAIREALRAERYHVLHITCHAGPGMLILEDQEGKRDPVDAKRFCDEILVPGHGVPVVVLAGCATALRAPAQRKDGDQSEEEVQGEALLPGLARQLLERGVPAVLAMQAPVSDPYATLLGERLYKALVTSDNPDPLEALSESRRTLERERLSGDLREKVDMAEWATPSLYMRRPSLPLYDPEEPFETLEEAAEPRFADGVVVRQVGDFIGRRREERLVLARLRDKDGSGALVHGIGGVGKSSLSAEVLRRLGGESWLLASVFGETSPDDILAEIGRTYLAAFQQEGMNEGDPRRQLAVNLGRPDVDWEERFELLSRILLSERPLVLLLDNFEDNLNLEGWKSAERLPKVKNEDLADLLSRWLRNPGFSRFLITSRHPFELPKKAHRRLEALHLGPLSSAETRKLIWRLPALDALSREEQDRAYADVGGHPRALEYLDALLRGGKARFQDVAERMEEALEKKGIGRPEAWLRSAEGNLDRALAETVTLAVDDVLFDRLWQRLEDVPLARELLLGASVYRVPVDAVGLAWQVSEVVEDPEDAARLERAKRFAERVRSAEAEPKGEESTQALTEEEQRQYSEDFQALQRPPLRVPEGVGFAVEALERLSLLAPLDSERGWLYTVHRWTASAVLDRGPADRRKEAHQRAAAYWRWRVARIPQSRQEGIVHLLEARHHLYEAGDLEGALELTSGVCIQLETWGAYRRAEQLYEEALRWAPPRFWVASAYHQLGNLSHKRGAYEGALGWYKKSLEIRGGLRDRSGMARSYHQLGMVAQSRGFYKDALRWYKESVGIFEDLGDRLGLADTYHQLGMVAQDQSSYEEASDWYRKSLDIFEELRNRSGLAGSYHQLGMVAQHRNSYEEALIWYRRSCEILEELGDQAGMASSYHQQGMVAQKSGSYEEALRLYKKSLEISECLMDRAGIARSYHQLGIVAQHRGSHDEAWNWFKQALQINQELGDRLGMVCAYHQLGMIAQYRGSHGEALNWYEKSLEIKEELGDRAGMARSYYQLGSVAQERGACGEALSWYEKALEIVEELGDKAGIASTIGQIGGLLTQKGSSEDAVRLSLSSLAIRLGIGSPDVRIDLYWLGRQREILGEEKFLEILEQNLDEESKEVVLDLMARSMASDSE